MPFFPDDQYLLGPDSKPQIGVPEGKVTEFLLKDSKAYPGFEHKWWLYVPAQYNGNTPIALMIFMDGTGLVARDGKWGSVPAVLNNLIAKHELPIMAAVFIDPGQSASPVEYEKAPDGSPLLASLSKYRNRSIEYESLNATYADFLINEILPRASRFVKITANPEGRGLAGQSSGANCAVTAAWERPDQFRKVFSAIGSFPRLVRGVVGLPPRVQEGKLEPIRIFFQDGSNDTSGPEWGVGAQRSQDLLAALKNRGYDYRFVLGEGTHNPAHAASIFPEAMRWLWRDYPR